VRFFLTALVVAVALMPMEAWAKKSTPTPAKKTSKSTPRPAPKPTATPTPTPESSEDPQNSQNSQNSQPPQNPADEWILDQRPPEIDQRILDAAHPSNTSIAIYLAEQRAFLRVGDKNAIDSPCSTGKREGLTPVGTFKVTEKHRETTTPFFGDFIDRKTQQVVRSGVNVKISAAPSGTVFRSTPRQWVLRLSTPTPVVIATGNLPGFPSTGGGIVLPENIAKIFFERTDVETPVTINE